MDNFIPHIKTSSISRVVIIIRRHRDSYSAYATSVTVAWSACPFVTPVKTVGRKEILAWVVLTQYCAWRTDGQTYLDDS